MAETRSTTPVVPDPLVYRDLGLLSEHIPERLRPIFCHRWGLQGHRPHLINETASWSLVSRKVVDRTLTQCLWNLSRYAHEMELPALRRLLGEDQARWIERAWAQADRWGTIGSRASETVLLLAIGGIDVPDARRILAQHLLELGLVAANRSGAPLTAAQHPAAARLAVDGIVNQVLWPAGSGVGSLDAFSSQRSLARWGSTKSGCFRSEKLGRLVQFDSTLELQVLRHLDRDPRVVDYVEQPLTIPYVIDRKPHDYTPDVAVLLDDGRVFLMEIKPPVMLGGLDTVIKLAALARVCGQSGYGLYAGSPGCGLLDFRALLPDSANRDLVRDQLKSGAITGASYKELVNLMDFGALSVLAASDLLDWRSGSRRVGYPYASDRAEARRFWALVDRHRSVVIDDCADDGRVVPQVS